MSAVTTELLMRCNTGIDLTVTEFVVFDRAGRARHRVPARLHCGLQHGHDDAHAAFAESESEDGDGVWWLRWGTDRREPVVWPYCLARDPDWPADADDDDAMLCGLPAGHEGGHEWQLQAPGLDELPGAHPVPEGSRARMAQAARPDRLLIRVHRHEQIMAVRWPDHERWLMIWPNEYAGGGYGQQQAAATEWRPAAYGADLDDPAEWIDPVARVHRDLPVWADQIRDLLAATGRQADVLLERITTHPYQR
jgi:hypothetical protein